jgi:hypothetical protein
MEEQVTANKIRYIKLGVANKNTKHCIQNGTMVLGFWTYEQDMFDACINQDWLKVESLLKAYRKKQKNGVEPKSVADDLRQVKEFFCDDMETIWITFDDRKLYWGLGGGKNYKISDFPDGPRCEKSMTRGWAQFDMRGKELRMDDIAGHISMVSQYRGTICEVDDTQYLLRRVNGFKSEFHDKITDTLEILYQDIVAIIKILTPKDFEILVEMCFVNVGWKRVGFAGRTEQTVDLILSRPSLDRDDDEIVAVQIKSQASQKVYINYEDMLSRTYQNAFFVYHTGDLEKIENGIVKLIDASMLAPMVVNAGLLGWLLERIK